MKTINVPEVFVEFYPRVPKVLNSLWAGDDFVWICISEPGREIAGNINVVSLKIEFYDLVEDIDGFNAPTIDDAIKIVDFIEKHKGRNILVNCAAGISRSGAVCKFLEDYCGYEWEKFGKENSIPNKLLYSLLEEVYELEKSLKSS